MAHTMRSPSIPAQYFASVGVGVLGSAVVAGLIAWRFQISIKEQLHGSWHVLLFALSCWLLYQDSWQPRVRKLMNFSGIALTTLRMYQYIRLAFILPEPPQNYAPLFSSSRLGWSGSALYTVVSTIAQVLLHRVLPGWACTVLGVAQALLFSRISYRYASQSDISPWRLLSMVVMPQVGMFAPYYLLSHSKVQNALRPKAPVSMSAKHVQPLEEATECKHGSDAPVPEEQIECTAAKLTGKSESEVQALPMAATPAMVSLASSANTAAGAGEEGVGAGQDLPAKTISLVASQREVSSREQHKASITAGELSTGSSVALKRARAAAAMQALQQAPYKSRLRASHTVCVKLDTHVPCSSLPADVAQQLQDALKASIGRAASFRISDIAVRSGCICMTMKLEESLQPGTRSQAGTQLCQHLSSALLPQLQEMLGGIAEGVAFQRAMLQLDKSVMIHACLNDKQAWDLKLQAVPVLQQQGACRFWMGASTVVGMQQAQGLTTGVRAHPACELNTSGLLELLAEVQLWGVSKAADVEGWVPPQQHMDSDIQWPGDQQPSTSSHAHLKLLARAHGGYLSTKVLRLMPASGTDAYVTAQVVIQLQEHELIRHHDGGTPSTLLLMGLELWQNEVLLSSSPLLSIPSAVLAAVHPNQMTASPWWWGAADSKVAAAMSELERVTKDCTTAGSDEDTQAGIANYVQYMQDLSTWLAQVQRTAYHRGFCHCKASAQWPRDGFFPTAMLHQPCLPPCALLQLGEQLMQYTKQMGCENVYRMLQNQLRTVAVPAAKQPCWASSAAVAAGWHAARAALAGYPCHHDERLYKQRLASLHMNGVLIVSSAATVLVILAWHTRPDPFLQPGGAILSLHGTVFLLFHLAAVIFAVAGRGYGKPAGTTTTATPMPLRLATWAYLWRALLRVTLAVVFPACFTAMFQDDLSWIPIQLFVAVTGQVQATAVLPARCVLFITLFMELPATVSAAPCKPLVAAVLLLSRLVLDAYMRCSLAAPTKAASGKQLKVD